jgi:hypothetical protein
MQLPDPLYPTPSDILGNTIQSILNMESIHIEWEHGPTKLNSPLNYHTSFP